MARASSRNNIGTTLPSTSRGTASTRGNNTVNTNPANSTNNSETSTDSIFYYESKPVTTINYTSDLWYGVYIYSPIKVWNSAYPIYTHFQYLFNINYSEYNAIAKSENKGVYYTIITSGAGGGVLQDSSYIVLDTPLFINNVNIYTFLSKIQSNGNKYSLVKKPEDPVGVYKLICKRQENDSWEGDINVRIIFKRTYPFDTEEVTLGDTIKLTNNSNYSLRFTEVDNGNKQSGLIVKVADVKNYLWFSVESYSPLKIDNGFEININDNTYKISIVQTNGYQKIKITPKNSSSNEYFLSDLNTDYGYSYRGNPLLFNETNDNLNNINSDYYFIINDRNEDKYISTFKIYLHKRVSLNNTNGIAANSIFSNLNDSDEYNILVTLDFDEATYIDEYNTTTISINDITSINAIRVSSNTHCSIDYINSNIKLYKRVSSNYSFRAAIYKLNKGETDFNGDITVFYGNKIVYPEYRNSSNKLCIPNTNTENKSPFYYTVERRNQYLFITIHLQRVSGGNNSAYYKFYDYINIYISDTSTKEEDTVVEDYSNVRSRISQDEITVHTVDISVPLVSIGDQEVFIDNSKNNKTKHYTNYSILPTENGYTYYGVRAIGYIKDSNVTYFSNDLQNIGINGLSYNVNANIVKLIPENEQNIIYSFKNGEQLLVLNQDNVHINFDEDEDTKIKTVSARGSNYNILSTKLSYEYIIEGANSANEIVDLGNIYYLTYVVKELKQTTYNTNSHEEYYINIPYEYTYNINPATYNILTNVKPNYPISYNINESINDNVYTYEYNQITSNSEIDENNIYKRIEEYSKIPANSVSLITFKEIVRLSEKEGNISDYNKYYKYSSTTNKYTPYKYSEVKDFTSIPLNIYVKHEYYLKTAEHKDTLILSESNERYSRKTSFKKVNLSNSTIEDIANKLQLSSEKYYQYIDGTYIPYNGFVRDGSVNYYGYRLRNLSEMKGENDFIEFYRKDRNISQFFIKQQYTNLGPLTTEEIYNLSVQKYDLYINSNTSSDIFEFININEEKKLTIFDLDLSGDTIYSSTNNRDGIIDIEEIRKKYKSIIQDTEFTKTKDDIERHIDDDEYQQYVLGGGENNFSIGTGDDKKQIKFTISIEGKYDKLTSSQFTAIGDENAREGGDRTNIYIKEEGYNAIPKSEISGNNTIYSLTDISFINTLNKYNCKDNIYTPLLVKLSADDLLLGNKLVKYGDNIYKYFYKVNNKYYRVHEDSGLILNSYLGTNAPDDIMSSIINTIYKESFNYVVSYDIHMNINKKYFVRNTTATISGTYTFTPDTTDLNWSNVNGTSYIISVKETPNNSSYTYDLNRITFYSYNISYYTYLDTPTTNIKDLSSCQILNNYLTSAESSYTEQILFKSKYFYSSYTINDGIHVDTNGSYYTNIAVFDSKEGKSYRKLYLNNHIQNIEKYSYNIVEYSYVTVPEESLANISLYDYDKYYIQPKDENDNPIKDENDNPIYEQLTQESASPLSYLSNGEDIYTKISETKNYKYNSLNSYQLSDNDEEPVIFKLNDSFYGLVFNIDTNKEVVSKTITFDSGHNTLDASENRELFNEIDIETKIEEFNSLDEDIVDSPRLTPDRRSALLSANNELYYNNYSNIDTDSLWLITTKFIPKDYKYELIELSKFIFRDYNSNRSIIQQKNIETKKITIDKPFRITNGENITFPGTYTWIPPTYKNIILEDGTKKTIIEQDGYYRKDYIKEEVPLKISSYNFYPKDEVSSINITYNYTPTSYILTAEISHPSISYNYMVNEIVERVRYTYILNGIEYDYPSTSEVSYENGTYYGYISLLDTNNSYMSMKIDLYKKNDIVTTTSIKEIEHQKAYVSYEYFSYSECTPLTNEKIPVLYATELIPATSHQVQFWDINKNSYSVKNVLDSYAYYSYKYRYETIPLKVASYIYTDDLRISNFNDLGTYVANIGDLIGKKVEIQSYSVDKLTTDLSEIFNNQIEQEKQIAVTSDSIFSSYMNTLSVNINSLNDKSYTSLSNLSKELKDNLNNLTTTGENSINDLSTKLSNNIVEQHNIIKEGLLNTKEILDTKLSDIKDSLHSDLIGEGEGETKEIELVTYTTTYTPVYEEDKIVPPIGPLAIVSAIQAVTQKKKVIGYTYETVEDKKTVSVNTSSIAQILSSSLSSTSTTTQRVDNEDGSYVITTGQSTSGLGDILKDLKISRKLPDYNEFMCDLVPKLFSSIDFDGDYDIQYDVYGNVQSKTKRNPTDMAKKCISRADSLWKEMKKKGIVS